jgi:hypothetical protein
MTLRLPVESAPLDPPDVREAVHRMFDDMLEEADAQHPFRAFPRRLRRPLRPDIVEHIVSYAPTNRPVSQPAPTARQGMRYANADLQTPASLEAADEEPLPVQRHGIEAMERLAEHVAGQDGRERRRQHLLRDVRRMEYEVREAERRRDHLFLRRDTGGDVGDRIPPVLRRVERAQAALATARARLDQHDAL